MNWANYLFGLKGRINRAKFWLAGLIIMSAMALLAGLSVWTGLAGGKGTSFGFNIDDVFRAFDPDSYKALSRAAWPALLIRAIGTVLFVWVFLATSIKRLHDRDKSGWWMVPFFAYPGLYNQFMDRLPDSYLMLPLALAAAVLPIWAFVELACLKGSRASNLFGPNPLGKHQMRPRSGRDNRPRATQGWDQQSEIEMVPHKAGPPAV